MTPRAAVRAALVNPPHVRGPGRPLENASPPLGIAYIAAALRAGGFPAELYDLADEVPMDPAKLAAAGFFDHDLYGFTSYTKTFDAALELVRLLKANNPAATIVFGGPHATPLAEVLVETYDEIDVVVRNEGEQAMVAIARHRAGDLDSLAGVAGLVYRKGGAIARTGDPHDLPPVDSLPDPARDYAIRPQRLVYDRRDPLNPQRIEFFSSSRGCPKRCTFCSIVVMSPRYRFRSVESLMDEIRAVHERDPFGHVAFLDANFFVHWRRTAEFAEALHRWDPGVTWSATATVDAIVRHPRVVERIGALNCQMLEVGVENGSDSFLARVNKRTTVEQNLDAIRALDDAGIELELDYIMFDPETTLEELADNADFLTEAELTDYIPADHLANTLRLYPGTPARSRYAPGGPGPAEFAAADLYAPIADPRAAAVNRVMTEAVDTCFVGLEQVVRACERAADTSHDPQEMHALAIAFRNVPFAIFRESIDRAGAGELDLTLSDLAASARLRELVALAHEQETRASRPAELANAV
ncbi:MAG TPA: radical SAM protein [Thermoleophilaceae bacterium]|jgi:radical SAM superfamily enzyme YgiQ (UPF0313 family)